MITRHPLAVITLEDRQGPALLEWSDGWIRCLRLDDNEEWTVCPARTLPDARAAVARMYSAPAWELEFVEPRADVPF